MRGEKRLPEPGTHTHLYRAEPQRVYALQGFFGLFEGVESGAGVLIKDLAFAGKADSTRISHKKLYRKPGFELGKTAAHGGLADQQFFCGFRQIPVSCDRIKYQI